jgi:hypothetical protein
LLIFDFRDSHKVLKQSVYHFHLYQCPLVQISG